MRGLFNYDGPLIRFFGKVGDCVILSVLWLVFSLPVRTPVIRCSLQTAMKTRCAKEKPYRVLLKTVLTGL